MTTAYDPVAGPKPPLVALLTAGGSVVETLLSNGSDIGARTMFQLDGDVVTCVSVRFLSDADAQRRHETALRGLAEALGRFRLSLHVWGSLIAGTSAVMLLRDLDPAAGWAAAAAAAAHLYHAIAHNDSRQRTVVEQLHDRSSLQRRGRG